MDLKKVINVIFIAASCIPVYGQETPTKKFPAQLTFVTPIGTSGLKSNDYTYNFSLNALAGTVGGVEGCEIGGLMNINQGNVKGVQVGGLINLVKGNTEGVQVGGIFNKTDSVKGVEIGGIFNLSKSTRGLQIGGIGNLTNELKGVQIGGIINLSNGNTEGVQLSGILNIAKKLDGFQLGLINIADSAGKGVSLGLINIYKKGFYDEWELSTSDYANVKLSYKAGSKRLYTIYSVGANFIESNLWIAGLGIGHITQINSRLNFQPELIYHMYFPEDFQNVKYDQSSHLKLGLVYSLSDKIGLSFAPSIYARNQENDKNDFEKASSIKPLFSSTSKYKNERVEVGIGLSLGLILR